jgi:hypothetical protein
MGSGSVSQAFGVSESHPTVKSPFGQLPYGLANKYNNQFASPGMMGLGFGPSGRRQERFDQRLGTATGPFASLIRDIRGFAPDVVSQSQQVGNTVSGLAMPAYEAYTNQIDNYLANLDRYTAASDQGVDYAQRLAGEAFDPVASRSLYQESAKRALAPAMSSGIGRGVYDSGGQQGAEQDVLTQLALQFAGNDQANQSNAISQLQGSAGNAAALRGTGADMASGLMNAIPILGQLLQAQYGMPMEAAGNLLQLLSGGGQQGLQLLSQVAPVVAQKSKGWSGSGSASGGSSGGGG